VLCFIESSAGSMLSTARGARRLENSYVRASVLGLCDLAARGVAS